MILFATHMRLSSDTWIINDADVDKYLLVIYQPEFEITHFASSYLDLFVEFYNSGELKTRLYDKPGDFHYLIVNFLLCTTTPHVNGVHVSQFSRYACSCHGVLCKISKLLNVLGMARSISALRNVYE